MQGLDEISALLPLLNTAQVAEVDPALVALCRSPEAMQYLHRMLTDGQVDSTIIADSVTTKRLAASHINRMMTHFASSFAEDFSQAYLLAILVDFAIPYEVKVMIIAALKRHARQSKGSHAWIKISQKNY